MVLTTQELKEVENTFIQLLRSEIGPLLKSYAGTNFYSYDDKSNGVDLVTALDKQIESIIKVALTAKYPSFKFIGEETYVKGVTKITNDPTFIVDPIDGTTNFIHGYPYSCTSLGLAEMGKPVVGVVFNPHLNQLFHASKGNGAFLNDQEIRVSKRPLILQKSLIALEGGSERTEGSQGNFDKKMSTYKNLLSESGAFVHGFRSAGSAAMNICYVASGMLDAYWEGGCWAWDVCAGWCILEEAGGIMAGGVRGEWDIPLDRRCYLAIRGGCEPIEQKEFAESFWNHVAGELEY
ncbi:inositol monophosphate 1-phosphatase INM2 [Saccharomyces paradoxus]|uniref:Inositol-1-monophosphatase n=1 Tax=Saccharomyces paradoxus TaxID=27291 RepID=A0A8B8UP16_SACPA|nr:Inm2 [Saccharomyces paradoxus]QHS72480.1 Inm2 [Saccharomyces paradoxus]